MGSSSEFCKPFNSESSYLRDPWRTLVSELRPSPTSKLTPEASHSAGLPKVCEALDEDESIKYLLSWIFSFCHSLSTFVFKWSVPESDLEKCTLIIFSSLSLDCPS
ncbi:unnamed protein product [Schistosoma curassoni]|uniref:Ovule protein n=1 Tax=Schistosoma curassoni TaxID=6186 RepID=A0A183KJ09_9TREM|nr:unnamed protein product [Schistosoma curassoni]